MDQLLANTNWIAIVVSAVAGFALGALWYSPLLFMQKWAAGSRINMDEKPANMAEAMVLQTIGTLLLAWLINVCTNNGVQVFACLAILMTAVLIYAGGGYSQKSTHAKMIESGFVLAMGALMMLIQGFF